MIVIKIQQGTRIKKSHPCSLLLSLSLSLSLSTHHSSILLPTYPTNIILGYKVAAPMTLTEDTFVIFCLEVSLLEKLMMCYCPESASLSSRSAEVNEQREQVVDSSSIGFGSITM